MRLLEKPLFHYKEGEEVPGELRRTGEVIGQADLFVTVSSEMNHTIAPGLVSMMSHFGSNHYAFKPSGIVTYSAGMWGGTRAGVALRPFLSELGCLPVSAMVALPGAIKAMGGVGDDLASAAVLEKVAHRVSGNNNGNAGEVGDGAVTDNLCLKRLPETQEKMLDRMLDQLEWQARSLRDARLRDGPPSASYFEQVRLGTSSGSGG